jgi:hypothetical protein
LRPFPVALLNPQDSRSQSAASSGPPSANLLTTSHPMSLQWPSRSPRGAFQVPSGSLEGIFRRPRGAQGETSACSSLVHATTLA